MIWSKSYAIMIRKNEHLYEEQVYYQVRFKDEIVSKGFLDFKVDEIVIVELKKDERFSKTHNEQVLDYLKRSGLKLAILINFTKEGMLCSSAL